MSGIIALYTDSKGLEDVPSKFMVGRVPQDLNGNDIEDGPVVRGILFREQGSAFGKRVPGGVFVVLYEESTIESYIPTHAAINVIYETKAADEVKTPELED